MTGDLFRFNYYEALDQAAVQNNENDDDRVWIVDARGGTRTVGRHIRGSE